MAGIDGDKQLIVKDGSGKEIGRYRATQRCYAGLADRSSTEIWKADRVSGSGPESVAVKSFGQQGAAKRDTEWQALLRLQGIDGVVSLVGQAFDAQDPVGLALEWAQGPLWPVDPTLPWRDRCLALLGWLIPIAQVLCDARDKGVYHRDIRCENILIDGYGRPKLADWDGACLFFMSKGEDKHEVWGQDVMDLAKAAHHFLGPDHDRILRRDSGLLQAFQAIRQGNLTQAQVNQLADANENLIRRAPNRSSALRRRLYHGWAWLRNRANELAWVALTLVTALLLKPVRALLRLFRWLILPKPPIRFLDYIGRLLVLSLIAALALAAAWGFTLARDWLQAERPLQPALGWLHEQPCPFPQWPELCFWTTPTPVPPPSRVSTDPQPAAGLGSHDPGSTALPTAPSTQVPVTNRPPASEQAMGIQATSPPPTARPPAPTLAPTPRPAIRRPTAAPPTPAPAYLAEFRNGRYERWRQPVGACGTAGWSATAWQRFAFEIQVSNVGNATIPSPWRVEAISVSDSRFSVCLVTGADAYLEAGQWTGSIPALPAGSSAVRTFAVFLPPEEWIRRVELGLGANNPPQAWVLNRTGQIGGP